jgi:hypothetical protein
MENEIPRVDADAEEMLGLPPLGRSPAERLGDVFHQRWSGRSVGVLEIALFAVTVGLLLQVVASILGTSEIWKMRGQTGTQKALFITQWIDPQFCLLLTGVCLAAWIIARWDTVLGSARTVLTSAAFWLLGLLVLVGIVVLCVRVGVQLADISSGGSAVGAIDGSHSPSVIAGIVVSFLAGLLPVAAGVFLLGSAWKDPHWEAERAGREAE